MVNIELEILNFIRDSLSNPLLDEIMKFITYLGSSGFIWITVTVVMLAKKSTRKTGVKMAVSLLLSLLLCNIILKPIVGRVRPYEAANADIIIGKPSGASFPSGHSSSSFAAAVTLLKSRSSGGVAAVILAALIAFSRLYLYVHYPSDVIFGALLGTAIAFAADWLVERVYKIRKMPL